LTPSEQLRILHVSSAYLIQGLALLEALSNDEEVSRYLSGEELKELTDTDYYTRYIDTSFKRVGL